ncbi:MAG: hypothetical protein HRT67_08475 [Flavobacteriaceae bacterium]|nr:hypothetical protein [Flavobacteriaceae bacterium]
MSNYFLLFLLLICSSLEGHAQDELLWLDVPKTVENPTNVYDKKARIKNNKIVIPRYSLKICRKNDKHKFYYKGKVFFNSSKFPICNEGFFSELFGDKYFITLLKPKSDTTFHNPISVKREKMLIIDFVDSPEEVFEVNLNGYLLLPSQIALDEMIAYNKENDLKSDSKIGIIERIDLNSSFLFIKNLEDESVKFKLDKRQNEF